MRLALPICRDVPWGNLRVYLSKQGKAGLPHLQRHPLGSPGYISLIGECLIYWHMQKHGSAWVPGRRHGIGTGAEGCPWCKWGKPGLPLLKAIHPRVVQDLENSWHSVLLCFDPCFANLCFKGAVGNWRFLAGTRADPYFTQRDRSVWVLARRNGTARDMGNPLSRGTPCHLSHTGCLPDVGQGAMYFAQ